MSDRKPIGSPIPCRACGYCTTVCPQNIGIKECFKAKNEFIRTEDYDTSKENLLKALEKGKLGKPVACEQCRSCEDICPNELPIRMLLQSISFLYDI